MDHSVGSSGPRDGEDQPNLRFKFIECSTLEAVRDRNKVRTARSHAMANALAKKRMKSQEEGANFRLQTFTAGRPTSNTNLGRHTTGCTALTLPTPITSSSIDPFETLSVNAKRLTALLHLKSSVRAGEPIFNTGDVIHYQSLNSVFGSGLSDGALTAALGLSLSFFANGQRMNTECLKYSSTAIEQIRRNLSDPVTAVSSTTIGTVLLLLGNAYRLGELQSANAHLHGLQMLLNQCFQRGVNLSASLRRAIFWQDLFASIFLGTNRIVDYTDFYPQHQDVKRHLDGCFRLPTGFSVSAHSLGPGFLDTVAEVADLYANRKQWLAMSEGPADVPEELDNVQAQLESRLHSLRQLSTDHMLLCCIIAAQLCVYGFWDGVWNSPLIPRELSAKLLHHLNCCPSEQFSDDDLLLWIVHVGKAFAIDPQVRVGLEEMWLQRWQDNGTSTALSWDIVEAKLSLFIWSDVLYSEKNGWFWERIRD